MSKEYEGLTREELIAMLRRRDSQARKSQGSEFNDACRAAVQGDLLAAKRAAFDEHGRGGMCPVRGDWGACDV